MQVSVHSSKASLFNLFVVRDPKLEPFSTLILFLSLLCFVPPARAVLGAVASKDGQPNEEQAELLAFSARFTSPVKPGDSLKTNVWITGESNGEIEVAFEQEVIGGKKTLGGGYARARKADSSYLT